MSYFKVKMHQIRFRLGSAQTPLGELTLQRSPDPLTGFKGVIFLREGKGREKGEKRKKGVGGRERKGEVVSWLWGEVDAISARASIFTMHRSSPLHL